MITPTFRLDQNETQLIIIVEAPYTNVKNTEIHVEGDDVRFYSAPYYLRLALPGHVEETDNSSAKYNSDKSEFVITLDKVTPGQHFDGLDMLASLLAPKGQPKAKRPLIEVMEEDSDVPPSCSMQEFSDDDWHIDQVVQEPTGEEAMCSQHGYGFANLHKGLLNKYQVELGEVCEIKNPDAVPPAKRWAEKYAEEQIKFSDDHYLSDLMLENDIPRLLEFHFDSESLNTLTPKNVDQMKILGNRKFILDKSEQKVLFFGMIDIIFSYCYDWRTSEGSHTIESTWNISRISASLSWFVSFNSIQDVIVSSLRRSLSFPLHRNWDLSMKVFQDTLQVLKSGPKGILVCLLDIQKLFNERAPYYLLNVLFIEEYCIWVQKITQESLHSLTTTLEQELQKVSKSHVNFDLPELEIAARLVEEEEMEDDLSTVIQGIQI